MKIKIYHNPSSADLEDLYAQYCFESDNGFTALDKRDVNSIALHTPHLLSLISVEVGENAINEAFESLVLVLKQKKVFSANKVLMKIVCRGGLSLGYKEKHQLESFVERFKPDILFKLGIHEITSGDNEVEISVLASMNG